jgi:signal transduction histidine kinase
MRASTPPTPWPTRSASSARSSTRRGCAPSAAAGRALAVRADGPKLRQVLVNLLGNAARHTPPGGTVCGGRRGRRARVRLRVARHGVRHRGRPARAHLRAVRARARRRTAPAQGTGLGLTISRALGPRHGRRRDGRERGGAGSTFTVTLPRG